MEASADVIVTAREQGVVVFFVSLLKIVQPLEVAISRWHRQTDRLICWEKKSDFGLRYNKNNEEKSVKKVIKYLNLKKGQKK